ncbi:MAG: Arm DNA-binding domain-containing protein [Rhodanobacteraceae bacterium]
MAKVRTRPDSHLLFMDFYYRGVRCREQTALEDTPTNRRRVEALLKRINKEIKQGLFDYAATFPGSAKAKQFAAPLPAAVTSAVAGGAASALVVDTPTFADFSVTWRAEMAPQWRRLHRMSVDTIFDTHLLPAFGNQHLAGIAKADVLAFRAELVKLPGRGHDALSPATTNKIFGILRQCLMEGGDRYGLPDVFRGIRRLKARRPDVHPFSLEEVERIRTTIRPDYRDYVTVRFFTGMRSGEINGLRWKHVDFENDLILVRETFSCGEAEQNAKTETSLRDIPMLPVVKEALQHQFSERNLDSEYVFCTREANPIDANNFANRVWYPLLRYLGLEKRRPYQTRHTTATLMLASGESPEWIAHLMGHANTQMLFTVYSRFVPNLTHKDGLAITGFLASRTENQRGEPAVNPDLKALSRRQLEAMVRKLTGRQNAEPVQPRSRAGPVSGAAP